MRNMLLAVLLLALVTGGVSARTWHISPDGSGDVPTIQAGIDSASAGDTVALACGTYTWTNQNTGTADGLIRMKSGITLRGEADTPEHVIIDGESQGRVILCQGVDNSARIEGLTITGGRNTSAYGGGYGGGISVEVSSPQLLNIVFVGSTSEVAGGNVHLYESSSVMIGCTVADGEAGWGGGVYTNTQGHEFTDCVFLDNSARVDGGGIYSCWSPLHLRGCVFIGNSASQGGGISYRRSWGIWPEDYYENCTFSHNAADKGGAIYCWDYGHCWLSNCIIAYSLRGASFDRDYDISRADLTCCDIYGNVGGDWVSWIASQYGTNGNFSACPSFCGADMEPHDWRLCSQSPCLPGNHPDGYDCGIVGAGDLGCECGPTAAKATTWGALKSLYR